MAILKPFKAVRPRPELAALVASRPYDVLNEKEAKIEAGDNALSFYHVIKPEIDCPDDMDHYAPEVYAKGKSNFEQMLNDGVFIQDEKPCIYIYRQTMNGREQYGIVGLASIEDYFNDIVKKHELTRPDKEEDRKNHVRVGTMHAEPVFYAIRQVAALDNMVARAVEKHPVYDFVADDGIGHTVWVVDDDLLIADIVEAFAAIPATYVADGHHRTAAAALVGREFAKANAHHSGNEAYNFFLAVHFPDNQLSIIDYNRVVKDLNGLTAKEFLEKLNHGFVVEKMGAEICKPQKLHEFSLYLEGIWYRLTARLGTYNDSDPIGVLDVTILSEQVLAPLLGIHDLRTDKRIDFVGGIRGLAELKKRVDAGEMKAAFALYPVSMKQLMDIADTGKIMPPKTTWFEPKLRSGLLIHKF